MVNRFIAIVFVLFGYFLPSLASTDTTDTTSMHGFGVKVHSGVLQYHHKEMALLRSKPSMAIELSYTIKSNGTRQWHKFYSYPEYGFGYIFMDLGNPEILGYSHAIYPFINLPIYSPSQRLKLGLYIGSGLGYITKTYHRTNNFKNTAISSHLNAFINLGTTLSYSLNKNFDISSSVNLMHYSNGTYKKPNSGLNYSFFSVGANYCLPYQPKISKKPNIFPTEKHRLLALFIATQKEVKGAGGPKYPVAALYLEYSYPLKALWRFGVSADFMYDTSNKFILDYQGVEWNNPWQIAKGGLMLNTEFILDRLSAIFAFGTYVYNLDSQNGIVYQRLGLRYRASNRIFLNVSLKTHWTIADYLELGIGFKLM